MKTQGWEEVLEILKAVHVHGVNGDYDEMDYPENDPMSMSVQTALKKITSFLLSSQRELLERVKKEVVGTTERHRENEDRIVYDAKNHRNDLRFQQRQALEKVREDV